MKVNFNSVQLTILPPKAYSFGVVANTFPGLSITNLHWEFGDGAFLNVPYCCQTQVSEVQSHTYSQPGPYTVLVVASDNAGNWGVAQVTVSWVTPVPEYPSYTVAMVLSLLTVLIGLAYSKNRRSSVSTVFRL